MLTHSIRVHYYDVISVLIFRIYIYVQYYRYSKNASFLKYLHKPNICVLLGHAISYLSADDVDNNIYVYFDSIDAAAD